MESRTSFLYLSLGWPLMAEELDDLALEAVGYLQISGPACANTGAVAPGLVWKPVPAHEAIYPPHSPTALHRPVASTTEEDSP